MYRFLVDTCVWLDTATDRRMHVLLQAVEELVDKKLLGLILPRTVVDEFERNKARIINQNTQSVQAALKKAKDLIDRFGSETNKKVAVEALNLVDQKVPSMGDMAFGVVKRIETLFSKFDIIEVSDAVKLRALDRALLKKAPFSGSKNCFGDAVMLEVYHDCVRAPESVGHRLGFVTHNTNDFSQPNGDKRQPHPDLAPIFTARKSRYFVSLQDAINHVTPDVLAEVEAFDEFGQFRSIGEILQVIDELVDKIWYDRHQCRKQAIEEGKIILKDVDGYDRRYIKPEIWKGALRSAKKVEKKYGRDNVGPYSKFDWGMMNGKLSALRWVLGEDWDMLDT